jgi:prepilin-type N-terminal cleavage/methylation domain-containing protein
VSGPDRWRRSLGRLAGATPRTRTAGRDEAGFTLPEVLITVVVTSIVVMCLSSSFVVGARTTVQANTRLRESHDAQMLATYFPADVASAKTVSTTSMAGSTCPIPGSPVVLFTWTESGVRKDAFYGRSADASQLVRQYCENNVAKTKVTVIKTLPSVAGMTAECRAKTTDPWAAAACAGSPTGVKLTVQHQSALYSYSIQGSRRTTAP